MKYTSYFGIGLIQLVMMETSIRHKRIIILLWLKVDAQVQLEASTRATTNVNTETPDWLY